MCPHELFLLRAVPPAAPREGEVPLARRSRAGGKAAAGPGLRAEVALPLTVTLHTVSSSCPGRPWQSLGSTAGLGRRAGTWQPRCPHGPGRCRGAAALAGSCLSSGTRGPSQSAGLGLDSRRRLGGHGQGATLLRAMTSWAGREREGRDDAVPRGARCRRPPGCSLSPSPGWVTGLKAGPAMRAARKDPTEADERGRVGEVEAGALGQWVGRAGEGVSRPPAPQWARLGRRHRLEPSSHRRAGTGMKEGESRWVRT